MSFVLLLLLTKSTQQLFQYSAILSINSTVSETEVKHEKKASPTHFDVLEVWNQYKQEHSQIALVEENAVSNFTDRKFAVGYYSCPLQAGNRLHHFMNSLIWAIVTNRTLLWKYYDKETCRQVGLRYGPNICMSANSVEDCDSVLKRAEWLPSLREWDSKLNLSTPLSLSYWTTHEASTKSRFWFDGAENEAGLADSTPSKLVNFPQMLGQDAWILQSERKRIKLLSSQEAKRRAELLFRAGTDYLYGLLFFDCFAFQSSVSVPFIADFDMRNRTRDTLHNHVAPANINTTIVVHSRHSKINDDGSSIKREKLCLDRVLINTTGFCQVMILSDRPKTLDAVVGYLNLKHAHCHAIVAHHDLGLSFSEEHGPFSGSGFYQDMAMVSNQTRHVPTSNTIFIGSKRRSSSQLVRELMAFQLQEQDRHRNVSVELTTCYLEEMEKHRHT